MDASLATPWVSYKCTLLQFLLGIPRTAERACAHRPCVQSGVWGFGHAVNGHPSGPCSQVIWTPPRPGHATARGGGDRGGKGAGGQPCAGDGIYVVMAGLVKSSYVATDGHTQVGCALPCFRTRPSRVWHTREPCSESAEEGDGLQVADQNCSSNLVGSNKPRRQATASSFQCVPGSDLVCINRSRP